MAFKLPAAFAALAAIAALAGPASAATNLISDGDFSAPYGGGSFTTYGGGGSMGPWTVTGNSVDLIGGYWQAPAGTAGSVDLDGNAPGGISQTFTAGPGSYLLTFDLSANPDGGPAAKTVDVSVGGVSQAFTYTIGANSHSSMNYVTETLAFTLPAGTSDATLAFNSLDVNSPYGPVVGDVSIAAVPEPATWMMLILGLGMVGYAIRRRPVVATTSVGAA